MINQEKNKLEYKIQKLQHKVNDKLLVVDQYYKRFNSNKIMVNKEITVIKQKLKPKVKYKVVKYESSSDFTKSGKK